MDCIIAVDEHSRIIEFNPAAEHTFGWTRAEILGQTLPDTIIPSEYRDAHNAGIRRYLETGEQHVLGRRIEMTALRNNGEIFPVELAIVEVAKAGERRFTAFLRDLTQQKQPPSMVASKALPPWAAPSTSTPATTSGQTPTT